MAEVIFKNRTQNTEKLLSFSFESSGNDYIYHTDLSDGQLKLTVTVNREGKIYTKVTDSDSGDEYVLHLVAGAAGSFVGRVKNEYDAVLEKISEMCFDTQIFKSKQAKEVISYVRDTYGDELEYLWQKFPDNAVIRRKDTHKWYAALLTVSQRKLGFDSDDTVEILDLRMTPEDIERKADGIKILPGYHMNKKHWITIRLNDSVPADEIYRLIEASYILAKK